MEKTFDKIKKKIQLFTVINTLNCFLPTLWRCNMFWQLQTLSELRVSWSQIIPAERVGYKIQKSKRNSIYIVIRGKHKITVPGETLQNIYSVLRKHGMELLVAHHGTAMVTKFLAEDAIIVPHLRTSKDNTRQRTFTLFKQVHCGISVLQYVVQRGPICSAMRAYVQQWQHTYFKEDLCSALRAYVQQ